MSRFKQKKAALGRGLIKNYPALKLNQIISTVLSAAMLSLAFSRLNLGILAWFALVPYFLAINKKPLAQRLFLSFIFGYSFFLGTIYWLIHVSLAGMLILCLYLSMYFLIFSLPIKRLGPFTAILLIPLIWVLLEFCRSYFLTGFGWGLIGYTQFKNLCLIQIADKTGVWGISYLVVLVNASIALFFSQPKGFKEKKYVFFIPALLLVFVYGYGFIKLHKKFPGIDASISVIQASIPQEEKWDPEYIESILKRYRGLTLTAAKESPDLIVWPETSVPGYLLDEPKLLKNVTDTAKAIKTNLLVGSPREDKVEGGYFNSALLFDAQGELKLFHDKIHLVPFGEYLPFAKFLWFLANSEIADFSAGENYTLFPLSNKSGETFNFAVLVCFEDIFPWIVRDFRERGADFFIVISNEAWFKVSDEPVQHLAMSVFRAVENRCWFVRCANTGISCFIDPRGKIRGKIKQKNRDIFIEGYSRISLSDIRGN